MYGLKNGEYDVTEFLRKVSDPPYGLKDGIYEMPKKYHIFENRNSPFSFGFDLQGINI